MAGEIRRSEKHPSDAEKPKDNSAHTEKTKIETSHFNPLESTAKLKRETNTEPKRSDIAKPEATPKPDSTADPTWAKLQLDDVLRSGRLASQSGDQGIRQLRDQTMTTDAGDRQTEGKFIRSSDKATTQDRHFEGRYRNFEDSQRNLSRGKIIGY